MNDADNDIDGDTVCGDIDNCPTDANPDQTDSDSDGIGDDCDACENDFNNDVDSDSVCGDVDNCQMTQTPDRKTLTQMGSETYVILFTWIQKAIRVMAFVLLRSVGAMLVQQLVRIRRGQDCRPRWQHASAGDGGARVQGAVRFNRNMPGAGARVSSSRLWPETIPFVQNNALT